MAQHISPFLSLPQEIRDMIYTHTLRENNPTLHDMRDRPGGRIKRIPIGTSGRWAWSAHHANKAPRQEYLSLQRTSRQLQAEITNFLHGPDAFPPVAKLQLLLEDPRMYTTITHIPCQPAKIRDVEVQIHVNNVFHPIYISHGSQNAILAATSDTLKRYIFRGPHLSRPSPLTSRLHIETVHLTVSFVVQEDDYGAYPAQVAKMYEEFMVLLRRFCRSGLPWGMVDAFNVRMDDGSGKLGPVERVFVTSNIWDEEDFMFFQYGGFNWDAGDTKVVQPDLIAW